MPDPGISEGNRAVPTLAEDERAELPAERVANTLSAAIGLLLIVPAASLLSEAVHRSEHPWAAFSGWVFGASLFGLYLSSTLYHALPPGGSRRIVRLCDHSGIFVLIAGTYTPFALGPLREAGGWWLFAIEWGLAALGIAFKLAGGIRYRRLSNALYAGMGWLGLLWLRPILEHMPIAGFLWMLAGGVAYTAGLVFYMARRRAYAHFIWHIFVLAGSACHFYAVLRYAI